MPEYEEMDELLDDDAEEPKSEFIFIAESGRQAERSR